MTVGISTVRTFSITSPSLPSKYASLSVENKRKERYLTFVDDYYNFIGELPDSPTVRNWTRSIAVRRRLLDVTQELTRILELRKRTLRGTEKNY